jgi:8-oxo-dGTP diphosphatase
VADFARKALGSAGALVTPDGRVLLVRRGYPPDDWVMPGGNADAGESPVATFRREVLEETGLVVTPARLTGVYYQADHRAGEFVHFVFAAAIPPDPPVRVDSGEVADWGLFAPDALPEPMSVSTRIRLRDALDPAGPTLPVDLPPGSEP